MAQMKCCHPDIQILSCAYLKIHGWDHNDSFAAFWRFYWNNKSGAFLIINGVEYEMRPDRFFLIPAKTRFSTRSEGDFSHFYSHFTAGNPFERVIPDIYSFPIDSHIRQKIRSISVMLSKTDCGRISSSLLLYSLIYESMAKLGKTTFSSHTQPDRRIDAVIEFLNGNTSRIISNEELAEKINMTTNGFIRLFNSATGTPPQKYSQKKRIEKASLLLSFSNKRIDEIAKETGFLDRYHFTKVFKRHTQQNPAEFRKNKEFIF